MKPRLPRSLRLLTTQIVIGCCIVTQVAIGFIGAAPSVWAASSINNNNRSASTANTTEPVVHVNRTVPKVEPPKTRLEFSSKPTKDEIFRAHVFEEPLVPIGAEPSAAEN